MTENHSYCGVHYDMSERKKIVRNRCRKLDRLQKISGFGEIDRGFEQCFISGR